MNDWVLKIDNLSVGFGIAGQARPVTERGKLNHCAW